MCLSPIDLASSRRRCQAFRDTSRSAESRNLRVRGLARHRQRACHLAHSFQPPNQVHRVPGRSQGHSLYAILSFFPHSRRLYIDQICPIGSTVQLQAYGLSKDEFVLSVGAGIEVFTVCLSSPSSSRRVVQPADRSETVSVICRAAANSTLAATPLTCSKTNLMSKSLPHKHLQSPVSPQPAC